MPRYSSVLFDLDGTLLDTLDDLAASVNHAMAIHGYPTHRRDVVRDFIGNGVEMLIRRALPSTASEEQRTQALQTFKVHYASHNAVHTRAYNGILEMLEALQQNGIGVAVVSNKNDENVKALCQEFFGLEIAIGDQPGMARKPAPDGVFLAMKQLNAAPEATLYVGDSHVDIETAQNAGLPCLSVTWGFSTEEALRQAGATLLADSPAEILPLVLGANP